MSRDSNPRRHALFNSRFFRTFQEKKVREGKQADPAVECTKEQLLELDAENIECYKRVSCLV
jgi:hypothetical protein